MLNAVLGLNSIGLAHNDLQTTNVMVERVCVSNPAFLRVTLVDLGTATVLDVSLSVRLPAARHDEFERSIRILPLAKGRTPFRDPFPTAQDTTPLQKD